MADNYDQIMPTYAPSMVALQNRQKMGDLLRQQSMDSPNGEMVSGHYVAPSWTQYAAQLLKGYMGGKMSDEATQGQADLGKQLQAAKTESINNMINTMPGSQYATTPDQTVMQTRPNSDQDVTKWILTSQQANPEGANAAIKMYEMQQQREAAKQLKEATLAAETTRREEASKDKKDAVLQSQNFLKQMQKTSIDSRQEPIVAVTLADGSTVYKKRSDALGEKVGGKGAGGEKPLTESQAASLSYGTRMMDADKTLGTVGIDYSPLKVNIAGATEGVPGLNYLTNANLSDKEQSVSQAQRNFINASLRKESGASISPSEFSNAKQQYFPQPGDSPTVIAQKADNRARQINSFKIASGATGAAKFDLPVPKTEISSNPPANSAHPADIQAILNKQRK